jgi:hypothetical protein
MVVVQGEILIIPQPHKMVDQAGVVVVVTVLVSPVALEIHLLLLQAKVTMVEMGLHKLVLALLVVVAAQLIRVVPQQQIKEAMVEMELQVLFLV